MNLVNKALSYSLCKWYIWESITLTSETNEKTTPISHN